MTVPAEWWTPLIGTLLPAAVDLVRRRYSSRRFGALLLAALTALTTVLTEIGVTAEGASFAWSDVLARFVTLFVAAVVAHYLLLKPAGLTGRDGSIAKAVPQGIGKPVDAPLAGNAPLVAGAASAGIPSVGATSAGRVTV